MSSTSFKIFVGIFEPKQIGFEGSTIILYNPKLTYSAAKLLDNNLSNISGSDFESCQTKLLDCEQNFVVPPPDECGGGQGPQGPPGAPGEQGLPGADGKCTRIEIGSVTADPDLDPAGAPTVSITAPVDGTPCQTQQLSFVFPIYGGGGGGDNEVNLTFGTSGSCSTIHGGTITACSDCNNQALFPGGQVQGNVSSLRLDPGIGCDLSIQKSSSGSTISGVFNVKNIGFIKIFAVGSTDSGTMPGEPYPDSAKRWVYYGHPSRYTISNNCLYPGTGANQEPLPSRFAFSTDIIKVLNLAENDSLNFDSQYNSTIPAFTPNQPGPDPISGVLLPFDLPTGVGQTILLSQTGTEGIVVPLYMGVNADGQKQYFINHKNHLEKGFRGMITGASIIDPAHSMWKYTIELGESSFCAGQDTGLFPDCLFSWSNRPGFDSFGVNNLKEVITEIYAYNLYETSNMPSYAIKLTGNSVPVPGLVSTVVTEGFKLQNSPDFYFGHVPFGTMVDIRIDRFGRFYFAAPNAVIGGCTAPTP
jgi:hypothetical protein